MLSQETVASPKGCWGVSDRILLVKLQGTPVGISGEQLYVPITNADGEGIEEFSDAIKLKL